MLLQPAWEALPLSLQHLKNSFLFSNYHQQASAAVCVLSLMSKSSSQIWPELGRKNMSKEISWSLVIRSTCSSRRPELSHSQGNTTEGKEITATRVFREGSEYGWVHPELNPNRHHAARRELL